MSIKRLSPERKAEIEKRIKSIKFGPDIFEIWLAQDPDGFILKGLWTTSREVLETEMIERGIRDEYEPVKFVRDKKDGD